MSILKYLHPVKKKPELPDHNGSLSASMPPSAVLSVNAKVTDVLEKQTSSSRGPYPCPEVSNRKASSGMWYNGSNSILPEEISRFTVE